MFDCTRWLRSIFFITKTSLLPPCCTSPTDANAPLPMSATGVKSPSVASDAPATRGSSSCVCGALQRALRSA